MQVTKEGRKVVKEGRKVVKEERKEGRTNEGRKKVRRRVCQNELCRRNKGIKKCSHRGVP
jgi:hypothetical protein